MNVKELVKEYIRMIARDGTATRDELIDMLALDEDLPDENKTKEILGSIADKILNSTYRPHLIVNDERIKLYNQGLPDSEIAKIQGVCTSAVMQWRYSKGLEANLTLKDKKLQESYNLRFELYYQGKTDNEIAEIVGLKACTIWNWRKINNLPPIKK